MARLTVWAVTVFALALVTCGGGDDGHKVIDLITGTAATGYPLAGTVTLKDSAGNQRQTTISNQGTFSIEVTGLTPPFVLFADGNIGTTNYKLYSAAASAGTVNITPLTNLIVASAAYVKNPKDVFDNPSTYADRITDAALNKAVSDIRRIFKPILDAHNVSNINPLSDNFTVYYAGMDAVLDTLKIDIDTNTGTVSIGNKQTGMPFGSISVTDIDNATPIKYVPYIYGVGGEGKIRVWWQRIMNAESYNLYLSTAPGAGKTNGNKIGDVRSTYEIANLTNGKRYYIVVTPVFSTGEGDESNELSVVAGPEGVGFTTLKKGGGNYLPDPKLYKITDQATFQAVWDTYNNIYTVVGENIYPAPTPKVDFSTDMVIVVASGSSGFDIEITKIAEEDGKLNVVVFRTSPLPMEPVVAALSTPLHIVKLRKSDLEPELFFAPGSSQ